MVLPGVIGIGLAANLCSLGEKKVNLPPVPADKDNGTGTNTEPSHGVSSVFLISRSNCAFVNYEEEVYLDRAVSFFNGRPLRPQDPRCPRLVCRVRRKDDDLRAGVGGQRGLGMHARWVQEQERRMDEVTTPGTDASNDRDTVEDPATSPSTYLGAASSSGSSPPVPALVGDAYKLPADLLGKPLTGDPKDYSAPHHSGSGSTNSSFLARNFPKRYFILKSLTQVCTLYTCIYVAYSYGPSLISTLALIVDCGQRRHTMSPRWTGRIELAKMCI